MSDVAFTVSGFKATGTPTARTIPDRVAEIKNVKDFGAIGNGVTDDHAAIMAAYNKGQVTLIATAPSFGNVITFANVPAAVKRFMYVIDTTDPTILIGVVDETSATTVTVFGITGTVSTGHTITFNVSNKGLLYFPPGTYYVSGPIDLGPEATINNSYIGLLGISGSSIIVGNFADYVIKRGLRDAQSVSGGHTIDKLTIINRHADGGGIRMGDCVGSAIRDCDITANKGINTDDSDTPIGGAYFGTIEICIENCNLRAYDAMGSFGIAIGADGPVLGCTFKNFLTGIRAFGGQGLEAIAGCYFETCIYGYAGSWGPDENVYTPGSVSAVSGVSLNGCHFKDCGTAILATSSLSSYRGIYIEATEGTIAGNPQYGILAPNGFGSIFSGIRIAGQYQVAGFALTGPASDSRCALDGISVSNTSTLGGVRWVLPLKASSALFSGCDVAPVYTMSQLPAFPKDIIAASWSSGTTHLQVGDLVNPYGGNTITLAVKGVTPSGFDGTFIGVTTIPNDVFSYSQSDPGSPTGAGGKVIINVGGAARDGFCFNVSDADTAVWGDVAGGGGSNKALVRWGANNLAWTVVGK